MASVMRVRCAVVYPPNLIFVDREGEEGALSAGEWHISGLTQLSVVTPYNFHSGLVVILPLHLAKMPSPSSGSALIDTQAVNFPWRKTIG